MFGCLSARQIENETCRIRGRHVPGNFNLVVERIRLSIPFELQDARTSDFQSESIWFVSVLAPHSESDRLLGAIVPLRVAENERQVAQRQEYGFVAA